MSSLLDHIAYLDPLSAIQPRNNFLWNQVRAPLAFRRRGWSAYHAPSYTAPLIGCRPLVLTAHDVSYLANSDWYPYPLDSFRLWYYRVSLLRADRIIVPSEFTRAELVRLCPSVKGRVRTIRLGVADCFFPDPEKAEEVRSALSLPREFLLHVGDIHARRNIPLLVDVAKQVGLPLVLVGRPLRGGEQFGKWKLLFTGLTLDQLRGIYSAATVFVYPSLYEGFGLPLLEAMACGIPVVAARRSCLPEVCGDAGVLVEPDVESLCEGVERARSERDRLRAAGLARDAQFSWEKTARETEEVYREVTTLQC